MNLVPRAVKEMLPRKVLPFALRGARNVQVAEPLAARGVPATFAEPIAPEQAMRDGLTAVPPARTRTVAATVDPALGFAGTIFAALAVAPAEPPPPPPPPCSATTIVMEVALFEGSLSVSEVATSSARSVYVPFCAAVTFQKYTAAPPVSALSCCTWHRPVVGAVLVHPSVGSGASAPQLRPWPSSTSNVPPAGAVAASDTPTNAQKSRFVTVRVVPFGLSTARAFVSAAPALIVRSIALGVAPAPPAATAVARQAQATPSAIRSTRATLSHRADSVKRRGRWGGKTVGMTTTEKTKGEKDFVTRLADVGEEALQRLSELPGGQKALTAFNDLKTRVDELSKKVRGIDELEARVAKLEKELAALKKSKPPARRQAPRKPAA